MSNDELLMVKDECQHEETTQNSTLNTQHSLVPKLRFGGFSSPTLSTLGEITKWSSGGTPPKDNPKYWGDDIPWISASSMRGSYYSDSKVWLAIDGLNNGSKLIKKGGILLLVRGSMLWKCIPVGVATRNLAFNQDVKGIEPSSAVGNVYLLHWFSSMEHRLLNMVVGTGIGAGKLDTKDLQSLSISLPPLPEQQKIAGFLTSVDERIDQLKRKKSLLQDYKKGVMQKLFSQELRFKDDNGKPYPDWVDKKLGEVGKVVTGGTPDTSDASLYNGQYLFVSPADINDSRVVNHTKKTLTGLGHYLGRVIPAGSVMFVCIGSTIGKLAQVSRDSTTNQQINSIVPNQQTLPIYLYYALKMVAGKIRLLAGNQAVPIINKTEFSKNIIPLPSLPEQTKIANFLSTLDQKIEQTDTQVTQTQIFKKGLLQQMFV